MTAVSFASIVWPKCKVSMRLALCRWLALCRCIAFMWLCWARWQVSVATNILIYTLLFARRISSHGCLFLHIANYNQNGMANGNINNVESLMDQSLLILPVDTVTYIGQTLFGVSAYNLQSISTLQRNRVWFMRLTMHAMQAL